MVRPMEEADYPIQTKDLFKGIQQEQSDVMKPEQMEEFKSSLGQLYAYQKKQLKLKTDPSVHLISDEVNIS